MLQANVVINAIATCREADASLYTAADPCKSLRYAQPNWDFEDINDGLPVLTAQCPGVRQSAAETACSLYFQPVVSVLISVAMCKIAIPDRRAAARNLLPTALATLTHEADWNNMIANYLAVVVTGEAKSTKSSTQAVA